MDSFNLNSSGSVVTLRLSGEVSIEHARPLYCAILAELASAKTLRVDAGMVTGVHPSIVQVLLAASVKLQLEVVAGSEAWVRALNRLGVSDSALAPTTAASTPRN